MFKSKFDTLHLAFNDWLLPPQTKGSKDSQLWLCLPGFLKGSEKKKEGVLKFALEWNQIISSFRDEDLISNREMDLMKIPLSSELPFNQLSTALSIARDFVGSYNSLLKKIRKDNYMYMVVVECYESLKYILNILVVGDIERRVIFGVIDEIEESIRKDLRLSELPTLHAICIDLIKLLVEGNEDNHYGVVKTLQDMFEVVTNDVLINGSRTLEMLAT